VLATKLLFQVKLIDFQECERYLNIKLKACCHLKQHVG